LEHGRLAFCRRDRGRLDMEYEIMELWLPQVVITTIFIACLWTAKN